jgi:uncharacterized membrane protein YbhN (UPF0104 family)
MEPVEPGVRRGHRKWLLPLKIVVSTAAIAYLASRVNFHLLARLSRTLPWMLLAGCVINLGALAIMASRWQALIHAAIGKYVGFRRLYGYYLIGAFYNNLLPGAIGGDFIRVKRLVDHHHLRWGLAVRITLVERLMGLAGVVLFVSATLPFAHIPAAWSRIVPAFALGTASILGFACFLATNIWLLRNLSGASMSSVQIARVSALVVFGQTSDMCTMALFLAILGAPVDPVNLIFSVGLAYLAAVLPISLGGLGVRESVLTAMLNLNGVDVATAALLSVLLLCSRLMTAAIGVAVDVRSSR